MKNILSSITIEEKNRILEMHQSATSKHYLIEQNPAAASAISPETKQKMEAMMASTQTIANQAVNIAFPLKGTSPIVVQSTKVTNQIDAAKSTGNGIALRLNTNSKGDTMSMDLYLAPDPKDKKVKLFSNFRPMDITPQNVQAALPRTLQQYMDVAKSGDAINKLTTVLNNLASEYQKGIAV